MVRRSRSSLRMARRPITRAVSRSTRSTRSPPRWISDLNASVTLTGAGFNNGTKVTLISPDGKTTYNSSSVSIDTFNQITATFDLRSECVGHSDRRRFQQWYEGHAHLSGWQDDL